jgi:hypothetical protein
MKTRIINYSKLLILSVIIMAGCVKEGPMGPRGYDGYDGNANVIASKWYTPTQWAGQTGDWYFDVANSEITADIVENGAILAYVSLSGDVYNDYTVRPLPAYAIGCNWDFLLPNDGKSNYGAIEFTTNMTGIPTTGTYNFRFIHIPASVLLKSSKLKSTKINDLKSMPYKEVCMLLGISE